MLEAITVSPFMLRSNTQDADKNQVLNFVNVRKNVPKIMINNKVMGSAQHLQALIQPKQEVGGKTPLRKTKMDNQKTV